ncbi:MAG: hypothetical protein COY80_02155 [Candidatus Pacebacteria bacterium CG_4_10_14_0_8_um_filter_42_14]|nr:MAG: hypothetical protein COY80_02155 [Candidatus Pacebacteria bacterium CG_4_10_14_0_8_um_filter_42_14]
MELVPTVFAVVLVILAIVLSVVGVQMVLVLAELKRTLQKVNNAVETAETKISGLMQPLQQLGGAVSGVKTGLKVFEAFVGWINKNKNE